MIALSPPHYKMYLILITSLQASAYKNFYLMSSEGRGRETKPKAHRKWAILETRALHPQ